MTPAVLPLYNQPAHLIRRAQQRFAALFNERLGHTTLTAPQMSVLIVVLQNENLEQKGVAAAAVLDPMTVSDIIRRLERKGLLRRDRSDRSPRGHLISLTDEGQALMKEIQPSLDAIQEELLCDLSQEEQRLFLTLLSRVARVKNNFTAGLEN
ncbi:MAG: MarR family winged helix-turn-helix transcriptional regulator [Rhizobiaceae bacterium]|nr:MarR family winged helix-turn-helix transcriptional regulator [Rhizobiaceae bacterium]